MSNIGSVNSTTTAATGTAANSASQELSSSDFLKILTTEMTQQDPSSPTSNSDFVNQMAQFSNMEQMQSMSQSFRALDTSLENYLQTQDKLDQSLFVMQSVGLIGKNVTAQVNGSNIEGAVDSIQIKDSVPYVVIGGNTVPVSSITNINQAPVNSTTALNMDSVNSRTNTNQANEVPGVS